jgi:mRNA-degrading endonuclease RelE of RelBE toxin-antitoxin system
VAEALFGVAVQPSARRSLARIPDRYAWALIRYIEGPLRWSPHRVGKRLDLELVGWRSARVDEYRIVYWIDEDARRVVIERIDHRADVYRPR